MAGDATRAFGVGFASGFLNGSAARPGLGGDGVSGSDSNPRELLLGALVEGLGYGGCPR